jgi:hypothetical protein
MLEEIIKDLDERLLQKEGIEKNLDKLRSRQIEVDEKKKRKENPPEERLRSIAEVPNKKLSILDRLGPKALPDHQKVDSWTNDRFLKIKEPTLDQKTSDHRFITNFVANTLSAHQKEISRDAEKLERQRALEKELEYKYSEEYLLEKESKEIVISLEENEAELVNVNKKIEELKEQLKNQKQLDREAAFSNFCKTKTKPSIYFRPAKIDDWVTKKFGLKIVEASDISENGKKTTREERDEREKDDEEEKEREQKKRKVEEKKEDDAILGVYTRSDKKEVDESDDDEIKIIAVIPAKDDLDFSIKLGDGVRTFIK